MNILICGVGAIGSNLTARLVSDLKGEHQITILDKDVVEERNITAGTQFYTRETLGFPKVEALQFLIEKQYQRDIQTFYGNVHRWLESHAPPNVIIDCLDNYIARKTVQNNFTTFSEILHVGFSTDFTFTVEWGDNYTVPTDSIKDFDICEMPGASAFVNVVASIAALTVEEYINKSKKLEFVGGKYYHNILK